MKTVFNEKFMGYLSRTELWSYIEDIAIFFEQLIGSMFGPLGNWKLIVDCNGENVITSCGGLLLESLRYRAFKSPVARMFVEEGLLHDKLVGDGTKYFLLLSSMLIRKGVHLLKNGLNVHEIIEGYRIATELALLYLEKLSRIINSNYRLNIYAKERVYNSLLSTIPMSMAPYSKLLKNMCKYLSNLYAFYGIRHLSEEDILVIKLPMGSTFDSRLLRGVIIEKEKSLGLINDGPTIRFPKIVVIRNPDGILRGDKDKIPFLYKYSCNIVIRNPLDLRKFLEEENSVMDTYIDILKEFGIRVLFTKEKLNRKLTSKLENQNIVIFEKIDENILKAISKMSGARLLSLINDLSFRDVGSVKEIKEILLGTKKYYLIKPFKQVKLPITVLVKGHRFFLKNAEYYIQKIKLMYNTITAGDSSIPIIPAGGATEIYLATKIREYANGYSGKSQLAINAYADVLEQLVSYLIYNMGLDPLETLSRLRNTHTLINGEKYGVDSVTRSIKNMVEIKKIESCEIKKRALFKSYDLVKTILRLNMILFYKQEMEEVPSRVGKRFVNI